jgi:protein-L-isoaspartate O-methyltransferase
VLAPSVFAPGNLGASMSARIDEDVREKFLEIYKPLRDEQLEAYELGRIASAIFHYRPLLSRLLRPTQDKIVVEIGSGLGWKALCWADLFASYTGIELDSHRGQQSVAVLRRFGKSNSRVITGNAVTIFRDPRPYGIERIDLLVLYAVLAV